VSARDQSSSEWRQIENRNIAFTIGQLPLTGVGLGQKYLVHVQPPPLYDFIYWQYITHNALLWLWLKAGPIAALALWSVVARALLVGAAIFVRGRDRRVRGSQRYRSRLVVSQIVFSSVDLGLTYSRSMIVLGTVLGVLTYLADRASPGARRGRRRSGSGMNILRAVARNIAMLTASRVATWTAALAFTIAQARFLGPGHFGELSVALTFAALLAIVMDFGLGTQLSRMVAQRTDGHEDALAATMAIRVGLWLLAAPALLLACVALGYAPELRMTILLLAVSVLLVGIANTVASFLQGREQFALPAIAAVAQGFTAAGSAAWSWPLGLRSPPSPTRSSPRAP